MAAAWPFLPGAHLPCPSAPVSGTTTYTSYYDLITKDKEVVKGVLLLTGSIEGTKQQVAAYTAQFNQYSFLWKDDLQAT